MNAKHQIKYAEMRIIDKLAGENKQLEIENSGLKKLVKKAFIDGAILGYRHGTEERLLENIFEQWLAGVQQ